MYSVDSEAMTMVREIKKRQSKQYESLSFAEIKDIQEKSLKEIEKKLGRPFVYSNKKRVGV